MIDRSGAELERLQEKIAAESLGSRFGVDHVERPVPGKLITRGARVRLTVSLGPR